MKFRFSGVFALTVVSALAPVYGQSLFSSTFESPDIPDLTTVYPGDTLLGPWTVTSGSVDLVDINNIWTYGPAFEGTQYIDLDGAGPGGMARTFSTTPGFSYILTFAYANNYHNQTSAWALVRLYGDSGDRLTQSINHSTSQAGSLDWSVFSREFTAADNSTTLEFSSLSPAGQAGGVLFDSVSVQAVPEPSTAGLLAGGLAVLSRRRRNASGTDGAAGISLVQRP